MNAAECNENTRTNMQLLHGHVSEETAYTVDDYPYGGHRTQCRWWVEDGGKKGQRVVQQTLNPKTKLWNKPHKSIYSLFCVLFLDEKGHCHNHGCNQYTSGILEFLATGMYFSLDEAQLNQFNKVVRYIARTNEWQRILAMVALCREGHDIATVEKKLKEARPDDQFIHESDIKRVAAVIAIETAELKVNFQP